MPILLYKKIGETPLESLDRLRIENPKFVKERLSYAGRLDPLAEGLLLVLSGEECNEGQRQLFLGLEKEYEVEVLFGLSTDSYDLLGISTKNNLIKSFDNIILSVEKILPEFIGNTHGLKYPAFSSKTVGGRALFELAKSEEGLPENLPDIKGGIKSIKIINSRSIPTGELKEYIHNVVGLVKGDFRQNEVLNTWNNILRAQVSYPILKLSVVCESGVYMRSLAEALGTRLGFQV